MSPGAVGALVVGALVVIYAIMVYNTLVALRNGVSRAWANIDVLLKQRHDEIPRLVETCKGSMRHERATLEHVIRARAAVAAAFAAQDVRAFDTAETSLRRGLGRLFALVEAYPDLKANGQFAHLQARITELENAIADRREFYNESVNLNNVGIEEFPAVLIANACGFRKAELLRFDIAERQPVDVGAMLRA